jgi:uncharacterized protein YcfJ
MPHTMCINICLKCSKQFRAQSRYNRICRRCTGLNCKEKYVLGYPITYFIDRHRKEINDVEA